MTDKDWRPRYLQVAESLRDQIIGGELVPGTLIASEPELAERYGLSRTSVRNAIKLLKDWGLLRSEQGRGTYVRTPRQRVTRTSERYQWEKDRVRLPDGLRGRTGATEHDTGRVLGDLRFQAVYEDVEADADLAKCFGVPTGTRLLCRNYRTFTEEEHAPLSVIRSYLIHEVVAAYPDLLDADNEPWPGGTQHQLSTVGIELDRITDDVTARPPLPEETDALDLEPGVSVLVLRKTSVDTLGRTVEVSDVIMPGDRTRLLYTVRLTRWADR